MAKKQTHLHADHEHGDFAHAHEHSAGAQGLRGARGAAHIDFVSVRVAVLAVSDSRDMSTDKSGALIAGKLKQAGHVVADRKICKDDVRAIRKVVRGWAKDPRVDFVIVTGGTGVTGRDVTPDAMRAIYTKHIPGFGELFRFLSYSEIGTSTIQSRADAGLVGDTLVFVLPGSSGAVRLGMDKIILDQLDIRHRPCNFTELLPRIRHDPAPAR